MPLEPRACNSGERNCEEEQVERNSYDVRGDAHPARDLWGVWSYVNNPPRYTYCDECENGQAQRLVDLPVEIAGGRVYALLGAAGSIDERNQNQYGGDPMQRLRHSTVARARAALHNVCVHGPRPVDASGATKNSE